MKIPDAATNNLYAYLTALGSFVCCVSIYAYGLIWDAHDRGYREMMVKFYDSSEEQKEAWIRYHEQQTKNVNAAASFLVGCVFGGTFVVTGGAGCWYYFCQRHEDEKLKREVQKAQNELENADVTPITTYSLSANQVTLTSI